MSTTIQKFWLNPWYQKFLIDILKNGHQCLPISNQKLTGLIFCAYFHQDLIFSTGDVFCCLNLKLSGFRCSAFLDRFQHSLTTFVRLYQHFWFHPSIPRVILLFDHIFILAMIPFSIIQPDFSSKSNKWVSGIPSKGQCFRMERNSGSFALTLIKGRLNKNQGLVLGYLDFEGIRVYFALPRF